MPAWGFDYGDGDRHGEEASCQNEIFGNNKDWCRPAAASMAKLNQVQANVYNMGFKDSNSLKPPRGMRKLLQQQQESVGLTHNPQPMSSHIDSGRERKSKSFRDLEPNPPLSTLSYQKTAWGSSGSIPELVARHGNPNKPRPSSAKTHSRPQPVSGLKLRPQSAKDPITKEGEDKRKAALGVTGRKKDVSAKSVFKYTVANAPGIYSEDARNGEKLGTATAGPPAGHFMSTEEITQTASKSNSAAKAVTPKAPCCSPVTSDGEEESEISPPSPLLRRPVPECIHLSLPDVNDRGYDDYDEDALDTERLLQQADDFVQHKMEQSISPEDKLKLANATMPPPDDDQEVLDWHSQSRSGVISSSHPLTALPPTGKKNNLRTSSDQPTVGKSESSSSFVGSEMSVTDESINTTASTLDSNSFVRLSVQVTIQSDGGSSEQCYSPAAKTSVHPHQKFILPEDETSFYEPLVLASEQVKPKDNSSGKGLVKFREDRNVTVDITPRNLGRKVESKLAPSGPHKTTAHSFANHGKEAKKTTRDHEVTNYADSSHHPLSGLVSTVTINYEDGEADTPVKKPKKNKKSMMEVETMISKLSDLELESESTCGLTVSNAEKNYYEFSRTGSRPSSASKPLTAPPDRSSNELVPGHQDRADCGLKTVYKTTKTIEFDPETPVEIVSKSAIASAVQKKHNEELNSRPMKVSSMLWPSTVKRQQEREKAKQVKEMKETKQMDATENNDTFSNTFDHLIGLVYGARDMAQSSLTEATLQTKAQSANKTPKAKSKKEHPKSASDATKKKDSHTRVPAAKPATNLKSQSQSQMGKSRPSSGEVRPASMADIARSKQAIQALRKDEGAKRYSMYSAPLKPAVSRTSTNTRRVKSASSAGRMPQGLQSVTHKDDAFTPETEECQAIKSKMASLGVDVNLQALERALYPPTGKPRHYEVEGYLPSDPSFGLLPHYKYWLPEEYKRVQMMKKRLAKDDHLRHMQKVREERKMKRFGKKILKTEININPKELARRNSIT